MSKKMVLMNELIEEISMGPFGSNIKVDNFVDNGVPVLNGANVAGIKLIEGTFNYITKEKAKSLKKANAKRGDIVITHRGTLGQICYIPNDSKFDNYVISQSQFRVTLKTDLVYPEYFVYYFHTEEGQQRLLANKSYVGVPALAQATTNFKIIDFPLIDISEQKKIALILSTLDRQIELNNQINQKLEAMAKTLYDYWFVQFDFSDANGKPYKSSGGKMVYSEELKREIPEGWEVFSLSSILKSNYSSIGKNNKYEEIKYLDTSSLTKNQVDSIEYLRANVDKIPSRAKRIVNVNDILYSTVRPNLCHYGIIKHPSKNMIASTGFVQLSSKVDWISNDLIYTYLTSSWITGRLQQIASLSVSSYPSISPNDILELNIALPGNKNNFEHINTTLNGIYSKISLNQKENKKLIQLRDWLLPMLMNGQVKVADAADLVDELMVAEPSEGYGAKK